MSDKHILVVDDESQIRALYTRAFTKAGYTVTAAPSAEQALEILSEKPIFVFFLDLNLPDMNGLELCKQIRSMSPMAIPIAVTGYASLFELADCRDAGFEDYFIKPARLADMLAAAEQAFKKLSRWKKR